eukprot:GHRQ01025777.1.p1 GENE.GHRQ01025777.1~~GHRQ01025777.1.p1  ORF type:complete len:159 (+),score=18.10 GHRQ01025777.1:619-1095(+)
MQHEKQHTKSMLTAKLCCTRKRQPASCRHAVLYISISSLHPATHQLPTYRSNAWQERLAHKLSQLQVVVIVTQHSAAACRKAKLAHQIRCCPLLAAAAWVEVSAAQVGAGGQARRDSRSGGLQLLLCLVRGLDQPDKWRKPALFLASHVLEEVYQGCP